MVTENAFAGCSCRRCTSGPFRTAWSAQGANIPRFRRGAQQRSRGCRTAASRASQSIRLARRARLCGSRRSLRNLEWASWRQHRLAKTVLPHRIAAREACTMVRLGRTLNKPVRCVSVTDGCGWDAGADQGNCCPFLPIRQRRPARNGTRRHSTKVWKNPSRRPPSQGLRAIFMRTFV